MNLIIWPMVSGSRVEMVASQSYVNDARSWKGSYSYHSASLPCEIAEVKDAHSLPLLDAYSADPVYGDSFVIRSILSGKDHGPCTYTRWHTNDAWILRLPAVHGAYLACRRRRYDYRYSSCLWHGRRAVYFRCQAITVTTDIRLADDVECNAFIRITVTSRLDAVMNGLTKIVLTTLQFHRDEDDSRLHV